MQVTLSELKAGDTIICNGFLCLPDGAICKVKQDSKIVYIIKKLYHDAISLFKNRAYVVPYLDPGLYVLCHGDSDYLDDDMTGKKPTCKHSLDGQEDETGVLIGVEKFVK